MESNQLRASNGLIQDDLLGVVWCYERIFVTKSEHYIVEQFFVRMNGGRALTQSVSSSFKGTVPETSVNP